MFNDNSDGEGLDENDEDTQWRMKRFEREQWLLENKQVNEYTDADLTRNTVAYWSILHFFFLAVT